MFRYTNPCGDIYVGVAKITPTTEAKEVVSSIELNAKWMKRVRKGVDVGNEGMQTVWIIIQGCNQQNYRISFSNPKLDKQSSFLCFTSGEEKVEIYLPGSNAQHREIIDFISLIAQAVEENSP